VALIFWLVLATQPTGAHRQALSLGAALSVLLWQPIVEELLFRGVLQGELASTAWGRRQRYGLSLANLASSAAFAALHFIHHPPLWAAAVAVPSLIFGHFRDRYGHVYASLLLHIYYNTGYFLLEGMPK
jgi:membrane protease YdiL (CAAX protease family)